MHVEITHGNSNNRRTHNDTEGTVPRASIAQMQSARGKDVRE